MNINIKNKIVAFVLARCSSEGYKNIKLFNGNFLIYYSIDYAKKCELVGRIYISKNDQIIAKIVPSYEINVIEKTEKLATSKLIISEAALHLLNNKGNVRMEAEYLLVSQSTNPLWILTHFEKALQLIEKKEVGCVFTVIPFKTRMVKLVDVFFNPCYLNLISKDRIGINISM